MTHTMTRPETVRNLDHLEALREGRLRHQNRRDRDARDRVDTYRRWLDEGSQLRDIPDVPSDADYAAHTRCNRREV